MATARKSYAGVTSKVTPPFSADTQTSFVRYTNEALRLLGRTYNMRTRMQDLDRAYQREQDLSQQQLRAKAANRIGNPNMMQNLTVPVVMPQTESALTELCNIFLSSYPLFPIVSKPQMEDAALQMETLIGEQGIRFGWTAELLQVMRDALKYNIGAAEVDWQVRKVSAVVNDPTQSLSQGSKQETIYAGNAIKRIDPYNLIVDIRVNPYEVHTKGEYAGYTEMVSRIELKRFFAETDPTKTMNAREAFESGVGQVSYNSTNSGYFLPQVNNEALITPADRSGPGQTINWLAWGGLEDASQIKYHDIYEKTVIYARLIPREHKIYGSNSGLPQVYKLVIINRRVCIYAERLVNAHTYLPIVVTQALEDGLGWQTKSFAQNAIPFQQLASSLFNSGIESQRRKVYDRLLYDPSRVSKGDIDNASSIARIPVKSEAYGKPVGDAVYQLPYRDDNVGQIFNIGERVIQLADITNGQNRAVQGQFQKGNKTRHEYEDVMQHSSARPRMIAIVLEARFFTPIKEMLKLNTIQFQRAGTAYNRNAKTSVDIDPVQLRAASLEFRMADGLMPSDEFVNMELFKAIMQMVAQNPNIAQRWDVLGMITYWMKLEGASWIDDFDLSLRTQQQPGQTNATAQPLPGAAAGTPAAPGANQ